MSRSILPSLLLQLLNCYILKKAIDPSPVVRVNAGGQMFCRVIVPHIPSPVVTSINCALHFSSKF